MERRFIRQILFPILAAIIWGTAFVFQSEAADHLGPFTFNALRGLVAALVLAAAVPVFRIIRCRSAAKEGAPPPPPITLRGKSGRTLLLGGLCCGTMLSVASNLQQLGIGDTSPGKTGFITALYIVLVPIFSVIIGKKIPKLIWGSVALAAVGLYFLCVGGETFSVSTSDLILLCCAVCFAFHILLVDHFSPLVDGVALSCVQFAVVAIESGIGMLLTEHPTAEGILNCLWPILYVGIFSSGVAYTLQILAQKNSNPAVVSLLLSLESFFSVVAEVLILGQWMSGRELFGCTLMLMAVILAQWPTKGKARRKAEKETEGESKDLPSPPDDPSSPSST